MLLFLICVCHCCLDPVTMVLEYAPHGCLLNHLRKNRPHTPGGKPPSSPELVTYAMQVAKGMAYLSRQKVSNTPHSMMMWVWCICSAFLLQVSGVKLAPELHHWCPSGVH